MMAKRRKKRTERVIHLSEGPLPKRLADQFAHERLVFCDASQKRNGGLAAVLFHSAEAEPLVRRLTVPLAGSNQLELIAVLFALEQAGLCFPLQSFVLFSDNQDAVLRLQHAQAQGSELDPELLAIRTDLDLPVLLADATFVWVKGHSTCRGNVLADLHAREAAS